ncbi:cytochrome c oxidase assembly protein COX19 [Diaphorina citri]|uniref:Cytochrome c oxidase assembly protein COX19 n=1 Tax=Diaphorina citri TaxID=121845 RepID=A0A1S4ET34_DIACI|nr:cytochrome c oxidase assembly protein COX19 [Diaphorina citri]XP_017305360.1 cytochrome c oxidase assembly protein COX19 [Diaphorina citri]XP_026676103.1 cytochrome c oxidase assembly protein COX19 [Diaphorina citri]XP_026676104.1 cytochrome c oxidase assembly protein COX19 [Diaphorina citri]KAI5717741.1 hypothetical protein M8J77_010487 [Diaphorina citri]
MSSMTFGQKKFIPTAPDKGSFPLDHYGDCKAFMTKYMICIKKNNSDSSACRDEIKDYLGCRMEKELMAKEDWEKLGLPASSSEKSVK